MTMILLGASSFAFKVSFDQSWLSIDSDQVVYLFSEILTFLSLFFFIFLAGFSVVSLFLFLRKRKKEKAGLEASDETPIPFLPALILHSFICFGLYFGGGMMGDSGEANALALSTAIMMIAFIYFVLGILCMIYGYQVKSIKIRSLAPFIAINFYAGLLFVVVPIFFLYGTFFALFH